MNNNPKKYSRLAWCARICLDRLFQAGAKFLSLFHGFGDGIHISARARTGAARQQRIRQPISKGSQMRSSVLAACVPFLFVFVGAAAAAEFDAHSAQSLAKKSGCLKCHSVTQKKDAPSYKEIASKYKGKADAEKKLITHLTTNPKVKVDGKEELHDNLKTKNEQDVTNVVRWILSR
jgi:cytochrome c